MVVGAVIIVLAAYLVVAVVRAHTERSLPQAADSYPIGRSRLEIGVPAADRITRPGIDSVWLWYPSVADHDRQPAPYAPGAWTAMHFPGPLGLLESDFGDLRIRSRENVQPAAGRFPLIILQPGLGFSAPEYQALAEDLAAAGFVVAGITPTGSANTTVIGGRVLGSTPQGNPADSDAAGARAQMDRLTGKWSGAAVAVAAALRHTKIISGHLTGGTVYLGHSLGGAASLQACHDDPDCLGAADLDGAEYGDVVRTGMTKPLMLISSNSCITGRCPAGVPDNPEDRRTAGSLLQHSSGRSWCESIAGIQHFNFSDLGDYYLALPLRKLLALGSLDGAEATRTIDRAVIGFATYATTGRSQPVLTAMGGCP